MFGLTPSRQDALAGLSVAGLILPEAMAYASMAGLTPDKAIYAAITGCFLYALLGQSRTAIVSPTSSSATVFGTALVALSLGANSGSNAMLIMAFSGVFFLLAGYLRLGSLSAFISRPVLRGFAFGLALVIILKQIPKLIGIAAHGTNSLLLFLDIVRHLPLIHIPSLVCGGVALAALLGLRCIKGFPATLSVLCVNIAFAMWFNLSQLHIARVGEIAMHISWPVIAPISIAQLQDIILYALPLTLILYAESWGTIRTHALAHGDTLNPNRELKALGVVNIVSALFSFIPVGAGFSASSANVSAGAGSRFASLSAALSLFVLLLLARPLIALIAEPVLAAIVIVALSHALSLKRLLQLWKLRRDYLIALLAALAVILFGVLNGLLIAVLLSLMALIRRMARPVISQLGQMPHSRDYVDMALHETASCPVDVQIFRPNAPLFFGNAERSFAVIQEQLGAQPPLSLILSLEESDDLDATALEALLEFCALLHHKGIVVLLARVHDKVRNLLVAAGQEQLALSASFSVADAVDSLKER